MMGEKKVKVADVARETGIHRGTVTRLYQETAARIDIEAMDSLCEYFQCKIGDIFEYVETTDGEEED